MNKRLLYLTAEAHFPSGEPKADPKDPLPVRTVGPGLLSDLDITDAEIAKLPRGVVRPATSAEIETSDWVSTQDNAEARRAMEELEAKQELERADMLAKHAALREKAADAGSLSTAAKAAKFDEHHAGLVAALDEKHARQREKLAAEK